MEITKRDWLEKKEQTEKQIHDMTMALIGYETLLTLCNERLATFPEDKTPEVETEQEITKVLKDMVS